MSALRFGRPELVRRGFSAADTPELGGLIARIVADGEPPPDVLPSGDHVRRAEVGCQGDVGSACSMVAAG